MTAEELKMTAWEMDATASALEANLEIMLDNKYERHIAHLRAFDEAASLQAYVHVLKAEAKAEAAKEGAA